MNCPKCQSPMSDAAVFCPACGHNVNTTVQRANQGASNTEGHDWLTTFLLAIFLGKLGVHRFYTGHILIGILMLCTLGCCGILWIVDIIMIATESFKDNEGRKLVRRN